MVLPDPRLIDATRIRDTKNRIEHVRSRSVYVAIAADGEPSLGSFRSDDEPKQGGAAYGPFPWMTGSRTMPTTS
jgi:hypothetical protein